MQVTKSKYSVLKIFLVLVLVNQNNTFHRRMILQQTPSSDTSTSGMCGRHKYKHLLGQRSNTDRWWLVYFGEYFQVKCFIERELMDFEIATIRMVYNTTVEYALASNAHSIDGVCSPYILVRWSSPVQRIYTPGNR